MRRNGVASTSVRRRPDATCPPGKIILRCIFIQPPEAVKTRLHMRAEWFENSQLSHFAEKMQIAYIQPLKKLHSIYIYIFDDGNIPTQRRTHRVYPARINATRRCYAEPALIKRSHKAARPLTNIQALPLYINWLVPANLLR